MFAHRTRLLDAIYVVLAAVVLSSAGVGAFFIADWLRVSPAWVCAIFSAPVAGILAGRTVRPKFRQPRFVAFFAGWLVLEAIATGLAWWDIGYGAVLVMVLGLVIFWELTARLFGPPEFMQRKHPGASK